MAVTDSELEYIRNTVISMGQVAARAYQQKKRMTVDDLIFICSCANGIVWTIDGTFRAVEKEPGPPTTQQH